MGTISEKLTYLEETKTRQKNLINALGGNITSDTPFREYEQELIDVLPKVTGEGTNISLSPTIEYDLDIGSLKGDTEQDTLEGYQLWGGFDDVTIGKFTTNTDGSISYTTGATGTSAITSNAITYNLIKTIPAGTYKFSVTGLVTNLQADIVKVTGTSGSVYTTLTPSTTSVGFTIDEEMSYFIRLVSNTSINDSGTVYLMLESGSTKHDFEPYCGRNSKSKS